MKKIYLLATLLCSLNASAYNFMVNGIAYDKNSDGKSVTVTFGGSKTSGTLSIPEKVTYSSKTYLVTAIGELAFSDCSGLTSLTIPNSVTSIGNHAFLYCIYEA